MKRHQWSLFYGLAILLTFVTVSCSRPAENAQSTKPSQTEIVENSSLNDEKTAEKTPSIEQPNIEQPKRVEEVKKKRAEPAPSVASSRPSASSAPVPLPAPAPPQPAASAPVPVPAPIVVPAPQAEPIPVPVPPAPQEPTAKRVTIPAGTEVYIRMIDSIDTERSHANETFRASLDKPIIVDNQTIIPKRSDVYVKLMEVQSAGKLSGTSELKVQLDRIFIGKQSYTVTSNVFTQTGAPEGKKAARNVGIGAAVGGVLGGIFGGTKGAVIGAGAGGGGGAVISKGEQIQINSETQLLFRLENSLDVTITPPPSSTSGGPTGTSGGPARLAPPPDRFSTRPASSNASSNENDLTGTWTVTTDGSQAMTLQLTLRQNGNNLQGSITNPRGSGTLPIRGSVNANYITFSTQSQYGAYDPQLQFSGAIQGDGMQGSVTMPSNTGSGNGGAYPGGGYPGGGRNRRTGGSATIQAHWSAQRSD